MYDLAIINGYNCIALIIMQLTVLFDFPGISRQMFLKIVNWCTENSNQILKPLPFYLYGELFKKQYL